MKSKFPGHFRLADGEIKAVWNDGLFVFDANSLLNLYRYSDTTREALFSQFEDFRDRVWLPHQAASEFFRNRISVIAEQKKSYDEMVASLVSVRNRFSSERGHPFISPKHASKFDGILSEIEADLNASGAVIEGRMVNDEILERLSSVFEGHTGESYSTEELELIFSEGEDRFKRKIPPGYMDTGKAKELDNLEDKLRVYGDLILWRQTIDLAKSKGKSIIFVTDDRKEDWWLEKNGKTISARPELVSEFARATGQHILFYRPDRFVEMASEHLGGQLSAGVLDEVRAAESVKQEALKANALMMRRPYRRRRSRLSDNNERKELSFYNALNYEKDRADVERVDYLLGLEEEARFRRLASDEDHVQFARTRSLLASSDEFREAVREAEAANANLAVAARMLDQAESDDDIAACKDQYIKAARLAEEMELRLQHLYLKSGVRDKK